MKMSEAAKRNREKLDKTCGPVRSPTELKELAKKQRKSCVKLLREKYKIDDSTGKLVLR